VKLVAGLGNPGTAYSGTRHNIGQIVVDNLAERVGMSLTRVKFRARFDQSSQSGEKVLLLIPQTYMNRSGEALAEAMHFYDIALADVLVVHDDLDLPLGRIRIACGGGTGGHNGLASIVESCGGKEFVRIRIGIGRPRFNEEISDYVLNRFYSDEQKYISDIVATATDAALLILKEGHTKAANHFNGINLVPPPEEPGGKKT